MSLLSAILDGRIPFSRKDDEDFLVTYINTVYYKQQKLIDRLSDEEQRNVLDRLLETHRSKWYFTWRVLALVPIIFLGFWAYNYFFGVVHPGKEFLLDVFVWSAWSFAATFIIFYTYKHYDLWQIARGDQAKQLINK